MGQITYALGLFLLGLALVEPSNAFEAAFQPTSFLGFLSADSVAQNTPDVLQGPVDIPDMMFSFYLEELLDAALEGDGASGPLDLTSDEDYEAYTGNLNELIESEYTGNLNELIESELVNLPPPPPAAAAADESATFPSPSRFDASSVLESWSFGSITESLVLMEEKDEAAISSVEQEQTQPCSTDLNHFLRNIDNLSTFAEIWNNRSLHRTLLPDGLEYTILAPSDSAFEELFALRGIDESTLKASPSVDLLLLHHILPRRLSTLEDLKAIPNIQTATCNRIKVNHLMNGDGDGDGDGDGAGDGDRDIPTGTGAPVTLANNCAITAAVATSEREEEKLCRIDVYEISCVFSPPVLQTWTDVCLE